MYQTEGLVNKDLLKHVGIYFIPYEGRAVFNVIVEFILILYLVLICCGKWLAAALILILAFFLLRARGSSARKCMEATVSKLEQTSRNAEIEYTSDFEHSGIVASNLSTGETNLIPYGDIVEIVLKPKFYLLISKRSEIIFVFREQLKDERGFIEYIFAKQTHIGIINKLKIRALLVLRSLFVK